MAISDSRADIYPPLSIRRMTEDAILNALAFTSGDKAKACLLLKLTPKTINKYLKEMGFAMENNGRPVKENRCQSN